jgi:hypothetical protein
MHPLQMVKSRNDLIDSAGAIVIETYQDSQNKGEQD